MENGSGTINPDTGLREYFLPLLMGGLALGKGILDAYGQEQQRKSQRAGYRKMSETTPSERKYQEHLRKIAEGGDPFQNQMMTEQMNRVVGNIRQTGAENLQRTEGSIIGQGMENSIVAAELRRKTSRDTMRSVAEQSRRITAENRAQQEQTKRGAQERLFQSEMSTDARKQQMEANIAGLGGYNKWATLGNIAMSGLGAYASAGGTFGQDAPSFDAWQGDESKIYEEKLRLRQQYGAGMPWEGIGMDTLKGMQGDSPEQLLQMDKFLESLDPSEQLRFIEHMKTGDSQAPAIGGIQAPAIGGIQAPAIGGTTTYTSPDGGYKETNIRVTAEQKMERALYWQKRIKAAPPAIKEQLERWRDLGF